MLTPLLISTALSAPLNDSLDPWGRPTHARVVIEPPTALADLYAQERRFRFWWDDVGLTATIEIRGKLRWKTLATEVPLGWISEPLPRDSIFRIRLEGGARTSSPLSTDHFYSPTDLARLSNPEAMLSDIVLDLDATETSDLWGATYSGGLVQITTNNGGQQIRNWTRWDGLPDDRVLSVSVDDDVTWVGMATGLAKIYDGKILQVWDDELVDPYVQTLDSKDGVVYIGTYQGLDRLSGQTLEHLLPAWSVFSLLTDGNKTAVGYEGITFIDKNGKPSTQDWTGNVDALAQIGDSLWMATENKGLVQSNQNGTTVVSEEHISDILHVKDRVYLAGDSEVWSLSEKATSDKERQGEMIGGSTLYTLADYQNRIWGGSSSGLHSFDPADKAQGAGKVPLAPWTTNHTVYSLLPTEQYGLIASLDGTLQPTSIQGEPLPLRLLEDSLPAAKLHQDSRGIWVWDLDTAHQIERTSLTKTHKLNDSIIDLTEWLGTTWMATESGLYKLSGTDFTQELEQTGIKELTSDGRTMWFRSETGVHHVTPTSTIEYATPSPATALSPSGLTLCVGTEDGLFRLWKGREGDKMWENPLGFQDQNVEIVSVVGDGKGGCWMAGEDGTIGFIGVNGSTTWWHLPEPDSPNILELIVDRGQIWVLTDNGTWLLW